MKWRAIALACSITFSNSGCDGDRLQPDFERTLSQAIRTEVEYPFGAPEAVLRGEEAEEKLLNVALIAEELGIRVDSVERDCQYCNLSPPVSAFIAIGDPIKQEDGSVVVPVTYISFGPPDGENFAGVVWEVTLRRTAGDWQYERVIETEHY